MMAASGDGNPCSNRSYSSSMPIPDGAWVATIGKNRAVAIAARRSVATVSNSMSSPFRCRSSSTSSSDSSMIDSISGPRRSSISSSSSASGSRAVAAPSRYSATVRRSRLTSRTMLPSLSTGMSIGWASPNTRWQCATVWSKSARACSSLVTATARGSPITAHSRQSNRVASSMSSSLAATTNNAASAARSPARTSPTKSG